MPKKLIAPTKNASWAKLYPIEKITVLQAQFFDNRSLAQDVKGRSDYALKLFAWEQGWNVDLKSPQWWRVVQLLDPDTVIMWARKKHKADGMTAEQLAGYEHVYAASVELQADPTVHLIKMGHIASPPGKQYFVGQFVLVWQDEGGVSALVIVDGHDIRLDLTPTRKRGPYRKSGSPTHAALHDPSDILEKQRRERELLSERQTLREKVYGALDHSGGMTAEEAVASYLSQQ